MWIEQARQVSLQAAGLAEGMAIVRNSIAPCPMCGATKRSGNDKRGPIGFSKDGYGWLCHRCGVKGDVVDLISIKLCGNLFRNIDKPEQQSVRAWFAQRGACPPINGANHGPAVGSSPPQPLQKRDPRQVETGRDRPPQDELRSLWAATLSIIEGLNLAPEYSDHLNDWLIKKDLSPVLCSKLNLVRVLPARPDYNWPDWWPMFWANDYRLAAPVYEMDGTFASIHSRTCCDEKQKPKTRWPRGYKAGGLLMANPMAVKMMRGDPLDFGGDIPGLLVCEGFTDFLRGALTAMNEGLALPIIAGTSGCFRSLREMKIPEGLNIFIATDPDDAGDEYADIISKQLAAYPTYRLPLKQQET